MSNNSKMIISIAPGGEYSLDVPQAIWIGDSVIMQICLIAGQKMMAIQKSDDEPDVFELHYMNFQTSGFKSLGEAKARAPEFAKQVLEKMSLMVN